MTALASARAAFNSWAVSFWELSCMVPFSEFGEGFVSESPHVFGQRLRYAPGHEASSSESGST